MIFPKLPSWFAGCFVTLTVPCVLADEPLQFNRDIRPILSEHCYHCHGNDAKNRMADLRLDQREAAIEAGAISPGEAASSELVARLTSDDPSAVMPPPESKKELTAEQKQILAQWINEGAPYERHWAFVPPNAEKIQAAIGNIYTYLDNGGGIVPKGTGLVDFFITQELAKRGLRPSAPAAPSTLLRRLSLDLVGLPPTGDEIASFTAAYAEDSDRAYAGAVERPFLVAKDGGA